MHNKSRWIPLSLGLLATTAANAQFTQEGGGGPWYIGARQEFGYYSNVRNAADGTPIQSDTVSRTGVNAGLDLPISRQRLFVDLGARYSRYRDSDDLNNTSYDMRAGLDWQTIERLSGTIVAAATQSLARLNPGNAPLASTRNLERTKSLDATGRLGGTALLGLEAGIGRREVEYSAPEYKFREYDQNSGSLGVSYRPSSALTLRTGVSAQDTKYPFFFQPAPGVYESDRSKRRDLYVGANWVASGISTLNARASYAKIEYDRASATDFSGLTGILSWVYRPTGKLQFVTTASRDTGQESTFLPSAISGSTATTPSGTTGTSSGDPGTGTAAGTTTTPVLYSGISTVDYSRVTNALSIYSNYQLSAKVLIQGGLSFARRTLSDPVGNTSSDRTTSVSLGVAWNPTRVLVLGCNAARDERSSSSALSSDAHGNSFSCYGQVLLN